MEKQSPRLRWRIGEKYHGLKRCGGGLALCFRMLKMALDELVPEGEVAQRNLYYV